MAIEELDPEIARQLLEGHKDEITGLSREREQFYQDQICPTCYGAFFIKVDNPPTRFSPNDPLPRYLLKCTACNCLFNPHSGIILTMGNLGEPLEPAVPLIEKD